MRAVQRSWEEDQIHYFMENHSSHWDYLLIPCSSSSFFLIKKGIYMLIGSLFIESPSALVSLPLMKHLIPSLIHHCWLQWKDYDVTNGGLWLHRGNKRTRQTVPRDRDLLFMRMSLLIRGGEKYKTYRIWQQNCS